MKIYDSLVQAAIPGQSFADLSLRQELLRLDALGTVIEREFVEVAYAVKEFLDAGVDPEPFDDPFYTDRLLASLDNLHGQMVLTAHAIASARGQIEILRMDRLAAQQIRPPR